MRVEAEASAVLAGVILAAEMFASTAARRPRSRARFRRAARWALQRPGGAVTALDDAFPPHPVAGQNANRYAVRSARCAVLHHKPALAAGLQLAQRHDVDREGGREQFTWESAACLVLHYRRGTDLHHQVQTWADLVRKPYRTTADTLRLGPLAHFVKSTGRVPG